MIEGVYAKQGAECAAYLSVCEQLSYRRLAQNPPIRVILKLLLRRQLQGKQGAECAAYLSVCEQLGYRSLTKQMPLKIIFTVICEA